MSSLKNKFMQLSQAKKISCLLFATLFIMALLVTIPSLARHKNRNPLDTTVAWDGSIASSYRSGAGTESDPYIISNAEELAYFSKQLETNDYTDTYFELNNDIIINNGTFTYDASDEIKYNIFFDTYYVKSYTNEYYSTTDRIGSPVDTLNLFKPLNNFKGYFNGNSFRIYGLYISEDIEKLGLFTNLGGQVKDLYLENSIIYGGNITGGVSSNTNGAVLNNILYNGYVIGKDNSNTKQVTTTLTDQTLNVSNIEEVTNVNFDNNAFGEITSSSLTGTLIVNDPNNLNTSIKINDIPITNGEFNIDLGTNLLSNISIKTYTDSTGVTVTLSNLTYTANYEYSVTGGIVGYSKNTTISNVINKAEIYGNLQTGGIAGILTDTPLDKSYNKGTINSQNIGAGLVGKIQNSKLTTIISNSYNAGTLLGVKKGLIGEISDNNTIELTNNFETTYNSIVDSINNTIVNLNNNYYLKTSLVNSGNYNDNLNYSVTTDDLEDKDYVTTHLLFGEYVGKQDLEENPNNVWVFEEQSLPILYIDDINKPIASIFANTYSWNNPSYELSELNITSNIAFSIQSEDPLATLDISYYISDSETPLSNTEIRNHTDWTNYNNIVEIEEEGPHVIYAKVVKNGITTYLNSDILVLDKNGPSITLTGLDTTWTNYNEDLNKKYINTSKTFSIEASDTLSGLKSLEYYISNTPVTSKQLQVADWTPYTESISLTEVGDYIIYAKAIDNFDNVNYVNTDYVIYNGYTQSNLNYGRNIEGTDNLYITSKSSISFNTTYTDTNECTNCTHNLISNIVFPINTKLTLIDNTNSKIYSYKITTGDNFGYDDSCNEDGCVHFATYPLTLFKEIGQDKDSYFTETNGQINDDYKVIIDFENTDIIDNYDNVQTYLELKEGSIRRTTLLNTIKTFNIYSTVNNENTSAILYLNVGNYAINLNSDSSTDINISTGLTYKYLNDQIIYDTTNEDKVIGLAIRLMDAENNVVSKDKYKNLTFSVDGNNYYPDSTNIVRINLEGGIQNLNKILTITTTSDNIFINEGNYHFEISNYLSYDGLYPSTFMNHQYLPVTVSDTNYNSLYNFNVTMDDKDRIIDRSDEATNIKFNLLESGFLYSPSIRVSLYKKKYKTAYRQEYELIDLGSYTTTSLTKYTDNVYSVPILNFNSSWQIDNYDNFEIDLVTQDLDKEGYKFVFELFEDNQKIGTIEKKFIIK